MEKGADKIPEKYEIILSTISMLSEDTIDPDIFTFLEEEIKGNKFIDKSNQ